MAKETRENFSGKKIRIGAVAKKVVESGGKKSVSAAMREVGYSDAAAHNPDKITKSLTWKELMKKFLPDDKIARVHGEQLEATSIVFRGKKKLEVPDNHARARAIDMAHKLKGRYAADKVEISDPYDQMSNSDLAAKIAKLKAHLLKKPTKK